MLNNLHKGTDRAPQHAFKIKGGIPSGPYFKDGFNLLAKLKKSSELTVGTDKSKQSILKG